MYFSHECFFEEVFSVCMLLVFKTWREMKASQDEHPQGLRHCEPADCAGAQAQSPHCLDINSFRTTLSSLPYSEIVKQLQRENDERKASERQSRAVNQLRDSFRAEIISLVNENRINVLCKGSRFQKYGAKGNRIKDGYVFVKLSHNLKALHYGDCNATCDDVDIRRAAREYRGVGHRNDQHGASTSPRRPLQYPPPPSNFDFSSRFFGSL
ncbi:hypothetical protein MRX96_005490 [Rhipicephalus microplus]